MRSNIITKADRPEWLLTKQLNEIITSEINVKLNSFAILKSVLDLIVLHVLFGTTLWRHVNNTLNVCTALTTALKILVFGLIFLFRPFSFILDTFHNKIRQKMIFYLSDLLKQNGALNVKIHREIIRTASALLQNNARFGPPLFI
jgi:hypothetical protein